MVQKTSRLVSPVAAGVLVMLGAVPTGCGNTGDAVAIAGQSIRYEISYSAYPQSRLVRRAISLSYATNDGQQDQRDVPLPWNAMVDTPRAGVVPSVQAQFYGYGTITCRILAGDRLIQLSTSPEGTYPTVECKG